MRTNPMQPLVWDGDVVRFKKNAVVRYLLDWATARGMGLNELASMPFTQDDFQHLSQLIGYSVSGYGDLSFALPEIVQAADAEAAEMVAARSRSLGGSVTVEPMGEDLPSQEKGE